MSQDLLHIIEQVGREKGIEKEVLIEAVESAVLSACKKKFKENVNIHAKLNEGEGAVELFRTREIVSDVTDPDIEISLEDAKNIDPDATDQLITKLEDTKFGRITAQAAKQVIFQKFRDAERESIYNEFKKREHDLINGTVLRVDRKDIIVDLGKTEALLPYREQSPREHYRRGDRIRVYILSVEKGVRGINIIVSRSHPNLVKELFQLEVPEISEGIVEFLDIVREAGGRSKISVLAHDKNVDPVGTCVGVRGARVQNIVRELEGEKIDIIKWTEEATSFVGNALSPASVISVTKEKNNTMRVVVADDQLSFAIGKNGQNAQLASRLTNYKIDIVTQANLKKEQEQALKDVAIEQNRMIELLEIDSKLVDELICSGFETLESIKEANPESLSQVAEVTLEQAQQLIEKATAASLPHQ